MYSDVGLQSSALPFTGISDGRTPQVAHKPAERKYVFIPLAKPPLLGAERCAHRIVLLRIGVLSVALSSVIENDNHAAGYARSEEFEGTGGRHR